MKIFKVLEPGLQTTVQDLGRTGYLQYGISPSGAMDDLSLQLGNILLGNNRNAAGLEITMVGPTLEALCDTVVALTGANLSPTVDGKKVGMWRTIFLKKGQVLRFGRPHEGARAYVTVLGGIQVPLTMGSRSTYLKGGFGGVDGRALVENDVLEAYDELETKMRGRIWSPTMIPTFSGKIRVVRGPQSSDFSEGVIRDFYSEKFTITNQSDRMGYRLQGKDVITLNDTEKKEVITQAVSKGTIQVPGNGAPILLMSDRQTSGGYPMIANVISVDLWKVAQRLPGEDLMFEEVTVEEAQEEWKKRELLLRKLELTVKNFKLT